MNTDPGDELGRRNEDTLMPATVELYDGSTAIDLLGEPYFASRELRFDPPPARPVLAGQTLRGVRYSPRTVEADLNIRASSVPDLRDTLRALESMCAAAERRMSTAVSAPVLLRCQLGDTDGEDVAYRVLRAEVALPPTLLREPTLSTAHAAPGARLRLLVEPFGRLASVSVPAATLHNEQNGSNVNYLDVTNIGGAHGALLQLKVHDPAGTWTGSRKMWIARRSGERRSDKLFFQAEANTGVEGTSPLHGSSDQTWIWEVAQSSDASGDGDNLGRMRWSHRTTNHYVVTSYTNVGHVRITVPGASVPRGLFRVLARVRVGGNALTTISVPRPSAMGFALGWEFGGRSRVPDNGDQVHPTSDQFETLDLGELALAPLALPDGYTAPNLDLNIYGIMDQRNASGRGDLRTYSAIWDVDYVTLLPIDEGAAILDNVAPADRILMDAFTDTPGVYILDSADVVQRFADFSGGPFGMGPDDTRIYVVRDEPGGPSGVRATLTAGYTPLVVGV